MAKAKADTQKNITATPPEEVAKKPIEKKAAVAKKDATKSAVNNNKNETIEKKKTVTAKKEKPIAKKQEAVKEKTTATKKATPQKVKTDPIVDKQIIPEAKSENIVVTFQLRYNTVYGQELFVTGNHKLLGNNDSSKALPMQYFNDEYWYATIELPKNLTEEIIYNYALKNSDGTLQFDNGDDKIINPSFVQNEELLLIDGWNFSGYIQNTFYTEPFHKLIPATQKVDAVKTPKSFTHIFQTKMPLLPNGQTVCLLGSNKKMGNWNTETPVLMHLSGDSGVYKAYIDLSKEQFPIAYKYGIFDTTNNQFIKFEDGSNRVVYDALKPNKLTIVNDAFVNLPFSNWRGAGIAIPVFGLKTKNSFGVGEFTDLKALADWSNKIGLKLIQILPINDTTATHTWQDSYPYAAISAFALHPIYLNLQQATDTINDYLLKKLDEKQKELNAKTVVDYEEVLKVKLGFLKKIFPLQNTKTFASKEFKEFFNNNKHWLIPYSCFCYLRDEYKTANYNEWPAYRHFNQKDIDELTSESSAAYNDISFHYFIQFHLHTQLLDATKYAHSKGIVVKGDIPIGIYRYGADAWQEPHLYNMNVQAGAPPDDFAVKGQNWGFPTYNWNAMTEDGFAWWRKRFEQMSYYFDAFRIDHILGFFRIWSIPMNAVEGIMGHFVPAIPVHLNELFGRGINFNHHRFTKPYITDHILWETFGYDNKYVKENFVNADGANHYTLKDEFATQRSLEKHFAALEETDLNIKLKQGLFDLISNVIFFEAENSNGQQFHFRFGMEGTSSFGNLDFHSQVHLKELYVDYFFKRQDDFWMKEAMQKLPVLKRVTNMLICGEDLGLVPACVPDVMKQLGLLSLEIQRMPKANDKEFFHPADAPYLSVVTPSTHDMSTIRGWWEEDTTKTQRFFNNELGQIGAAPFYCNGWINKAVVIQHLYSPAMWAIFQLQDLLGIDENIRRENPNDERINVPANPKHYWQYRMNISMEELEAATDFNTMLKDSITMSGR